MNIQNDPKIMIGIAVIFFTVAIYFYINYQIEISVKKELHKIKRHKQLKDAKQAQMLKRQQYMHSKHQSDQDSYYDPADDDRRMEIDADDDFQVDRQPEQRLTKDNILMRDMMGM